MDFVKRPMKLHKFIYSIKKLNIIFITLFNNPYQVFIMNLPNELWSHILILVPNDTFNMSMVCKNFMTLLNNRKCDDIKIIQNDSHLLARYFVNKCDYVPPNLDNSSLQARYFTKAQIQETLDIKSISSDTCIIIIGHYKYFKKHIDYKTQVYSVMSYIDKVCITNNIKCLKYMEYILKYLFMLLPKDYVPQLYNTCLRNKSFDVASYLVHEHIKKTPPDYGVSILLSSMRGIIKSYEWGHLKYKDIMEIFKYLIDNNFTNKDELYDSISRGYIFGARSATRIILHALLIDVIKM